MQAFPQAYVRHNVPFILLSGLSLSGAAASTSKEGLRTPLDDGGFRVKTPLPEVEGATANDLLKAFDEIEKNSDRQPENTTADDGVGRFKFKNVGRSYNLPPRKAAPPPHQPRLKPLAEDENQTPLFRLHSTISPLSPSSPIYPEGIFTSLWITKHQDRLPAVCITFFDLIADPNTSTLSDNQLKNEIRNIKEVYTAANYKTKCIFVLLGDVGGSQRPELDDRVGIIRRVTGLDSKTLLFLSSDCPPTEVCRFVHTLLSSLQTVCLEYYRDISKRARRKRNRSTIPTPTIPPRTDGSQEVLGGPGWNVRYEFKLGILAEFRQEMDAACRNFESAYEILFGPSILESISTSAPRFDELKLLADVISIRIIRAHLWMNQTTAAVRTWLRHRDRSGHLIASKLGVNNTYRWGAWQATWSKAMAELVERADTFSHVPAEAAEPSFVEPGQIFRLPEKSVPLGEKVSPWEMLHHSGYWLLGARDHTRLCRALALKVPEKDRSVSNPSISSAIARRTYSQDTYLPSEPRLEYSKDAHDGYGHPAELIDILQDASSQFFKRGQLRSVARIELELAKTHMEVGNWENAQIILESLWSKNSFRHGGGWQLLADIGWALRETSLHMGNAETLLRVEWELQNRVFPDHEEQNHELSHCLDALNGTHPRPAIVITAEERVSCVTAAFCFATPEGHVGEPLNAQLSLRSHCHIKSNPLRFSEVKVVFEGGLQTFRLICNDESIELPSAPTNLLEVFWHDRPLSGSQPGSGLTASGIASKSASANLILGPGQINVYNLTLTPRQAGEVNTDSICLLLENEKFSLTSIQSHPTEDNTVWWHLHDGHLESRRIGKDRDSSAVKILPKPPKVRIEILNQRQVYYTTEVITLDVNILNGEAEAAICNITAGIVAPGEQPLRLQWKNVGPSAVSSDEQPGSEDSALRRPLGLVKASTIVPLTMIVSKTTEPASHEVEIAVDYYLEADPETPLQKFSRFYIELTRPFEANYTLLSRHNPRPWPNFFEPPPLPITQQGDNDSSEVLTTGISHKYALTTKLYSFMAEPVRIEDAVLVVRNVSGGANCAASTRRRLEPSDAQPREILEGHQTLINPGETQHFEFDLEVEKLVLGDRHTVALEMALDIAWRRPDTETITHSNLEIPRYALPMGEPRVLLLAHAPSDSAPSLPSLRHLTFIIENPSMHFLSFSVTMESSEDLAFSGPKATSLSLVPLSRHSLEYRVLALKMQGWVQVKFLCVDSFFGKTLGVNPANEMVRADKKGGVFVWIEQGA